LIYHANKSNWISLPEHLVLRIKEWSYYVKLLLNMTFRWFPTHRCNIRNSFVFVIKFSLSKYLITGFHFIYKFHIELQYLWLLMLLNLGLKVYKVKFYLEWILTQILFCYEISTLIECWMANIACLSTI
jgi:hypothetical protein